MSDRYAFAYARGRARGRGSTFRGRGRHQAGSSFEPHRNLVWTPSSAPSLPAAASTGASPHKKLVINEAGAPTATAAQPAVAQAPGSIAAASQLQQASAHAQLWWMRPGAASSASAIGNEQACSLKYSSSYNSSGVHRPAASVAMPYRGKHRAAVPSFGNKKLIVNNSSSSSGGSGEAVSVSTAAAASAAPDHINSSSSGDGVAVKQLGGEAVQAAVQPARYVTKVHKKGKSLIRIKSRKSLDKVGNSNSRHSTLSVNGSTAAHRFSNKTYSSSSRGAAGTSTAKRRSLNNVKSATSAAAAAGSGSSSHSKTRNRTLYGAAGSSSTVGSSIKRKRSFDSTSNSGAKSSSKSSKKLSKQGYCMFYIKYGKCTDGDACRYKHDPDKVRVCTKFLQGACDDSECLLTHKVQTDKMPVCQFYLKGACGIKDCPYRHVNVNRGAPLCPDFLRGYCAQGADCLLRHELVRKPAATANTAAIATTGSKGGGSAAATGHQDSVGPGE
jgi:hypothetical protein